MRGGMAFVGRPARSLRFPGRRLRRTLTGSASGPTPPRWAAAAAAAGLVIGIALGASYQYESRGANASHHGADPERRLLARERRARLAAAIDRLDGRQRTVFMLCHYGDCTPREVSAMTGINESTVRVHLFRAARKLRGLLGGKP